MIFLTLPGSSGTESIFKLIGLLILCALIIVASYFVTRFIGKRQMGVTGDSNFESIDIYRLSQNKYLQLIRIGKRYFVIAVGKDTVTTIVELDEADIVFRRNQGRTKVSFKEIMEKMNAGSLHKEEHEPDAQTLEGSESETPEQSIGEADSANR